MKWQLGFWAGLLGVSTYGAVQTERYERGEALAKYLILAAAGGDRQLFNNLLKPVCPVGANDDLDGMWAWARDAARQVHDYKNGAGRDFSRFTSFKEWCVSLY